MTVHVSSARRVVERVERDASVVALERSPPPSTRVARSPRPYARRRRSRRSAAASSRSTHSAETIRPAKNAVPQRPDVRRRRVDAAVAAAAHRQVEHVRAQAVREEVTDAARPGSSSERRNAVSPIPAGSHTRSAHELVVRNAARALGEQRRARRSRRCSTRSSSPAANFVGWPPRTGTYSSVVASSCTGTGMT